MAILDYAPWRPPLVIGIVGESGGGKTRSALELARGSPSPEAFARVAALARKIA